MLGGVWLLDPPSTVLKKGNVMSDGLLFWPIVAFAALTKFALDMVFSFMMAFAWAIGGEKYFGKWKRGMLVATVTTLYCMCSGIWWEVIPLIFVLGWALYQALFYDDCIQMIWDGSQPWWRKLLGYCGLFVNGWLCGLIPAVVAAAQGDWWWAAVVPLVTGVAFIEICYMSNALKYHFNGCYKIGEVKIWCPGDSWWYACWVFGLVLGLVTR